MIPITRYGLPQVVIYPLANLLVMVGVFFARQYAAPWVFYSIEALLFVVFVWQLSFFRDPPRRIPTGEGFLLSPADGTITAAEVVKDERFDGGEAFKITIFLSVFNVHINRMPCDCVVEGIEYKPGKFINALDPNCTKINEANEVTISTKYGKMLIRQISGAIARRIVCEAKAGDAFKSGQKFGMIKFGSCTELYLVNQKGLKCVVANGQKVRAGLTKLIEFDEIN